MFKLPDIFDKFNLVVISIKPSDKLKYFIGGTMHHQRATDGDLF